MSSDFDSKIKQLVKHAPEPEYSQAFTQNVMARVMGEELQVEPSFWQRLVSGFRDTAFPMAQFAASVLLLVSTQLDTVSSLESEVDTDTVLLAGLSGVGSSETLMPFNTTTALGFQVEEDYQ